MKFGLRTPSLKKRIAARTSWKRYVRHNLGFKAPRGWGWLTNPKKAAYNRVYNRTTVSVDQLFKSGSRRRGSRHDGSAALLVIGVFVVAAFGVYLIAAAAVVFIGWLVRVATKRPAAPAVDTSPTIPPALPSDDYQALMPVDAAAFADPAAWRATAGEVFSAWLQHIPKAPAQGIDLIRGIEVRKRLVGRLISTIEGRRFTWHASPASPRQPIGSPPVDPASLDPWNPPPDLRSTSRYIATCFTCHGQGRVACPTCAGAGRVGCAACQGAGKYYGMTANGAHRLLNCKACKGKGSVGCDGCKRGSVDCATCGKAKKVECWLAIDESSRQDVQVEPDGELTKAFAWGRDGAIAGSSEVAQDGRIVGEVEAPHPLAPNELPASAPQDWRREYWQAIQPTLQPGERIRAQHFTLLDIPLTEVTYAVLGETQKVAFEGLRMLAPPPWSDVVLARRATILGRAKLALAALPLAATAIYLARGSYFVGDRAGPLVAGVVAAAALTAVCAYRVLWHATLGRRTARRWAMAAIVPVVAATALAVAAEPTTTRARSLLDRGQLVAARTELAALGSASEPELAPLWAVLYLKQALATTTCADARASAEKIPATAPQRARAFQHADELAVSAAKHALEDDDSEAAAAAIGCATANVRDGAQGRAVRGQIAIAAGQRCLRAKDWDCALARSGDARKLGAAPDADALDAQTVGAIRTELNADVTSAHSQTDVGDRLRTETAALALWSAYLASRSAKEPPQIMQLVAAKARDERAVAHQAEIERQRAAAKEKRRLAAEKLEQERQEAEERRQAYRPLVCGDGTLSPSCVCGGSWRGCCSHHGGVSGCQ